MNFWKRLSVGCLVVALIASAYDDNVNWTTVFALLAMYLQRIKD